MPLIEKRYAEALVGLSVQNGAIDDYQQELLVIVELFENQPDFRLFLLNPEINIEIKKTVIRNAFGNNAKKELVNFLFLLLDKGRIINLPGILYEFTEAADKIKNTLNITIISAAPLDDKQVRDLVDKYKRIYNMTNAKLNLEIDESLIGGVKIKIGDKIVDGTITGRLKGLKELLLDS
jgi:F-type H+-transporting ATPase subunit delta